MTFHPPRSRAIWLAHLTGILLLGGCGYASEYQPPRDGRARVVWKGNRPQLDLSGIRLTQECRHALESLVNARIAARRGNWALKTRPLEGEIVAWKRLLTARTFRERLVEDAGRLSSSPPISIEPASNEIWVPHYYYHSEPKFEQDRRPPPFDVNWPPVFSPRLRIRPGSEQAPIDDPVNDYEHTFAAPGGTTSGELLTWYVVSSVLHAGPVFFAPLALFSPFWHQSQVIPIAGTNVLNAANAYNDLARTPGSPCAYEAFEAEQ